MRTRAAAVTLLLGVAAATACTPAPEPAPSPTGATAAPAPTPPPRSTETPGEPAPRVLTEADTGSTVTLAPGDRTQLRLTARHRWEGPAVTGDAVELVPVLFETDPGYAAWDLHAVRTGRAVVTATARPEGHRVTLTVVVRVR
ncbi:hypothetical protein ACFPM3_16875 [Streptomyces coeruleoprunus]|uniref:Uncharacterized protein n=1 Tax=Streptomyces coeruleoprunus TaxID=285563 RepID=A0ABV9XI23_9ACTN